MPTMARYSGMPQRSIQSPLFYPVRMNDALPAKGRY